LFQAQVAHSPATMSFFVSHKTFNLTSQMQVVSHDEQKAFHHQHANCMEPTSDRKDIAALIDMVCVAPTDILGVPHANSLSIRRVSLEKLIPADGRVISNGQALPIKLCEFAEKLALD
jgi:hypothetical protein